MKENFRIRNEREGRITIWSPQLHAPEKVFLRKKFLNVLAFWSRSPNIPSSVSLHQ
jgi:hypothetical protein